MSIASVDTEVKEKDYNLDSDDDSSAHSLRKSTPWEAGFNLVTANNCAFILGYPILIMPALGWAPGITVIVLGLFFSVYANVVLARLNIIDGVRYYRFCDLSGKVFGPFGYWLVLILQWATIIGTNVGAIILAGEALKGFCQEAFNFSEQYVLWEYIFAASLALAFFGIVVTDMHNLRLFSIISSALFLVYCTIIIALSIYDGLTGVPAVYTQDLTVETRITDYFAAISTTAFAYNTIIIPEIQATIKHDPVTGFFKAMTLTFAIGGPIFLLVTLVGFWAYGVDLDANLISNLSGPSWALALIWLGVFTQTLAVFQLYCTPVFEAVDSSLYDKLSGPWSPYNIAVRTSFRVPYIFATAFVAALLPFFGDFSSLIGALCILPLSFVITFLLHLEVNKGKLSTASVVFHQFLVILFSIFTVGSVVASIKGIVADSVTYSLFANV